MVSNEGFSVNWSTMNEVFLSANRDKPLALVTGAARRVGKLIALHLARQGYAIGLHFNTSVTEAQKTAEEIRSIGVPAYLLAADLTSEKEINDLFEKIDNIQHPIKVLVNSAAVMKQSDLMKINIDDWEKIMNLNMRSVWLTSRESALRMQTGGSIINISDVGARKNWTGYGAYTISKSAVETLTRLMARQLAPSIRVNAIAPGLMLRGSDLSEEEWQTLIDRIPLKKAGNPQQLLATLDFLISNEYITGEIITLAGGYQLV